MAGYVLRRLAGAVPTIFLVVTIAFFMIRLAPGGPFDLERPLDPLIMANLNRAYNLDKPLGSSISSTSATCCRAISGRASRGAISPSLDLFRTGLPVSIQLGSLALSLALVDRRRRSGVVAALRQNRAVDYAVVGVATFGLTIPTFVIAPLLSLVFGVMAGLAAGRRLGRRIARDTWSLPVATLALPQIAIIARLTRGAMIEALRSDHVRTARAYGLPGTRRRRRACAARAPSCRSCPISAPAAAAAADRLRGRRDDLRHSRHRPLFRSRRARPRLHAGHGNGDRDRASSSSCSISIVDILYAWLDPRVRYD